jgi:hypothetical protein
MNYIKNGKGNKLIIGVVEMKNTIFVNDGFNGHKVEVYLSPVLEETENSVKLQVAEKGKEYMFKWVWKKDLV